MAINDHNEEVKQRIAATGDINGVTTSDANVPSFDHVNREIDNSISSLDNNEDQNADTSVPPTTIVNNGGTGLYNSNEEPTTT